MHEENQHYKYIVVLTINIFTDSNGVDIMEINNAIIARFNHIMQLHVSSWGVNDEEITIAFNYFHVFYQCSFSGE